MFSSLHHPVEVFHQNTKKIYEEQVDLLLYESQCC